MKRIFIVLSGILLFAGCGESDIGENVRVSECGGFEDRETVTFKEEEQKCDQLIIWEYNEKEEVLSILNQDVRLNCCGQHDVSIEKNGASVVYTMIDNPNFGRCDCTCSYDYSADIGNVSETKIDLSVFTDVAENDGPESVWEGTIDLSEESGTIVVKERSGDDCW